MKARLPLPLLIAALSLLGALAATVFLYLQAERAAASMLEQRLLSAGTAAALLVGTSPDPGNLLALTNAESLDGVFLVDGQLQMLFDTNGSAGHPADLLRVDPERITAALAGTPSIGGAWDVGAVSIRTGYFPVRDHGAVVAVLGLEAGVAFTGANHTLQRALSLSLLLAVLGALALGVIATRLVRIERAQQDTQARVARADLLTQIAAVAAHEIRNPLGVIRGTVELMQERIGEGAPERDRTALADVLAEVVRLNQLTEDLLDLSADRPLALGSVFVEAVLTDTVEAARAATADARISLQCAGLPELQGDAGRLRQVFANLVQNAVQAAGPGAVAVTASADAGAVRVQVSDEGPGIAPEIAARLFEPFVTGRAGGTGLGLAISRRIVERHGGTLRTLPSARGAVFEVTLPTQSSSSP